MDISPLIEHGGDVQTRTHHEDAACAADANAGTIVILTSGGPLGWSTINAMAARFGRAVVVLQEDAEPKSTFMRRRLKLIGPVAVIGQLAFSLLQKRIRKRSRDRLCRIIESSGMQPHRNETVVCHEIGSVNSPACRERLRKLNPAVVLVHGTRIIKKATLDAVAAPFINFHAGINPKYRGQHGAYWARAEGDERNAGITIHLIDEGVDTGQVLYQERVQVGRGDNITTYQYLQTATAIPLMIRAAEDALEGRLLPKHVDLPSKQWFHPTLWGYLYTGLTRRVW